MSDRKTMAEFFEESGLQVHHPKDYAFMECKADSLVGEACQELISKARDLIACMPDTSEEQRLGIWLAVLDQCEVFYRG